MELRGLTARQVEIADMLWECDDNHDIENLLVSLSDDDRKTAETLMIMITQEALEEILS